MKQIPFNLPVRSNAPATGHDPAVSLSPGKSDRQASRLGRATFDRVLDRRSSVQAQSRAADSGSTQRSQPPRKVARSSQSGPSGKTEKNVSGKRPKTNDAQDISQGASEEDISRKAQEVADVSGTPVRIKSVGSQKKKTGAFVKTVSQKASSHQAGDSDKFFTSVDFAQSIEQNQAFLKLLGVAVVVPGEASGDKAGATGGGADLLSLPTSLASLSEASPAISVFGVSSSSSQGAATTAASSFSAEQSITSFDAAGNLSRIAKALQHAVHLRGGAVTLRMNPPELGVVRVEIQFQDGSVQARFEAEHPAAQRLIQRNLAQLRQALHQQGLVVEKLEVQTRSALPLLQSHAQMGQSPSEGRSRGQYAQDRPRQETSGEAGGQQDDTRHDQQALFQQTLNAVG